MSSRVFWGLSGAFGLCLLIMGFQNCDLFLGGGGNESEAQIARSVCVMMGDTRCDKDQDFVMPGRAGGVLGSNEAVLVDPSQTVFLEVSLNASAVDYKWYNSTSILSYDKVKGIIRGNRLTRNGRSYRLPECSSENSSPREMGKNSLHFFHVEASHAKKQQSTSFLVACVEKREGTTALSEGDSLSSPGVLRKYCVDEGEGSCAAEDAWQAAGDLVLIHGGESIKLKTTGLPDVGVRYSWYKHADPQVDCSVASSSCKRVKNKNASFASASTVDISYSGGAEGPLQSDACNTNEVVYFHSVAQSGDTKKQAVFRVACM